MHKNVSEEFNFFWDFNTEDCKEELEVLGKKYSINFEEEKYKNRLLRTMKEKGHEIFESGKFNPELFQYVVKEYFENKAKKEDEEE